MVSRREFLKLSGATVAGLALTSQGFVRVLGAPAADGIGLSDPALQPMFANPVPDALAPGFIYQPDNKGIYNIDIAKTKQWTGLIDPQTGKTQKTWLWGYGDAKDKLYTWPGRTFQVTSGPTVTQVNWNNGLKPVKEHLLPVDTNLHWCYSLHGYKEYSIAENGIPIITHLHGGHTNYQFDGNPEFFYSPGGKKDRVVGPQWANVPGGFTKDFIYDNDVRAGNLWYHDHALGITRLNVYAGLAGFYFVRDEQDTGLPGNPLSLPAWPYEKAYAIQDRMYLETGELFYPAYPGDPYYEGFITDEGAVLPPDLFPGGGPTALAEFFGDHMVVNGMNWPYEAVEPRNYRLHLLNGTDSRFMAIRFRAVPAGATDFTFASAPLPFTVIGSDQGLADSATTIDMLLSEPGSRYDVVFDFSSVPFNSRVIMENIGGDEPFGGDLVTDDPALQVFGETDRVMAFDVVTPLSGVPDTSPSGINFGPDVGTPTRLRKVALFEGKDEFGRLQPLLGTAEQARDEAMNLINWPNTPKYTQAVFPDGTSSPLTGPMEGSIAWDSPTTENPALDDTEEWEIWNMTGDAHPVHLHLVHFEVLGRQEMKFDSAADNDGFIPAGDSPDGDGVYLVPQPTVQHNSVAGMRATYGQGFKIVGTNLPDSYGADVPQPTGYVENTPKDMVTALPGQITRIKATFDKPGRYVWHCHILSHEDHEMMRVLYVGEGANPVP